MEELQTIIDTVAKQETAGYPFREMEQLINVGEPAVESLLRRLSSEDDDAKPYDCLPLIVVLGEIRSPRAIELLAKFVREPKDEVLASVAAEALAKIGAPALPVLTDIVTNATDPAARLYAYGALGYMKHPAARELLLSRLEKDAQLADVVAYALSLYGKKEDAERIFRLYESLPDDTLNAELEESIFFAAHPGRQDPTPVEKDWRIRYRRLPEAEYAPEIVPLDVMLALHRKGRQQATLRKPLEKILASTDYDKEETCPNCGERFVNRTGLPVCTETAFLTVKYQVELVKMLMESNCETVQQAFDLLDNFYEDMLKESDHGRRQKNEDLYLLGVLTMNYFVGRKIYRLQDILVKLGEIGQMTQREYEEKYGPLHHHHHHEERAHGECGCGHDHDGEGCDCGHDHGHGHGEPCGCGHHHEHHEEHSVGRNDACPCGSGKKYKKCCGK